MEQTQVTASRRQLLLDSLQDSQVLPPEDLARAANLHPAADGPALAQALVAAGLLTRFQIDAITNHNYQDLRIGNYDVLDRIGAGGMGTVFKARHRRMKRIVALKVLARNLAQDPSFVQRFQREMETIARLTHPNVVMAYDADEDTVGHFLVMEFVEGEDLASLVQKRGVLAVPDAVQCLLQAARGLEYAHAQGIIHRDVKPANLLRDVSGTVKVTDLGLARLTRSGAIGTPGSGLTQAGGILGTVDYMPPEQAADSSSIDDRADIYSLGASLHYLLLGQPVYHGRTLMATLLKHRDAPIPSLIAARADVPPSLDALFQRLLAKHPDQRPQTMTEVVHALEAILVSLAPAALPIHPAAEKTSSVESPNAVPLDLTTSLRASQAVANQTVDLRPGSTEHGQSPAILLVEPSRAQAGIIRDYCKR